jgi:glutamate/tyrosine decarboxylase-like PLP-dependent enzyme
MKFTGAKRLGAAIARNIVCAKYFESLVRSSDDFEMLAPVELSIFCFRYKKGKGDLNALNERILIALQKAGSSYLSNATLRGKFALRGCVLNYRTTTQDMDQLLADVRSTAKTSI